MNVRLQYDVDFLAGIYYENRLQINSYTLSLNMLTKTVDPVETNIAMDRLKFFMSGEIESTVFINQSNMPKAEMLQVMGVNITTLPEEPVDQIIGMMLYYKLNAIMEGRIEITQLDVSSSLGDGVWYLHDEDDSSGPFVKDGWWHQATTRHEAVDLDQPEDNVVKVVSTGWHELGLEWPDTVEPTGNTVVFGNFPKK